MNHDSNEELLSAIGAAFDDVPEPPDQLVAAARDAFSWRRADVELAKLLDDSIEATLVGVRGGAGGRRAFRYGAGDFVIRVHLTDSTLIVMLEPPLSVVCRVASDAGTVEHRTDELGELVLDVPELPLRLEVDLPRGTTITPWIVG